MKYHSRKEKGKQSKEDIRSGNQHKEKTASMKWIITPLFLVLISVVSGLAQDTASTPKTFWDDPIHDPMAPLYLISAFVLVVIVLVMLVALYLIRVLNLFIDMAEKERLEKLGL